MNGSLHIVAEVLFQVLHHHATLPKLTIKFEGRRLEAGVRQRLRDGFEVGQRRAGAVAHGDDEATNGMPPS